MERFGQSVPWLLLHYNIYHSIQTYNLSPGPLTMYFWLYFCPLSHQQFVFAIYICTCACICICGCICHFYLWLYYGAICPPSHQVFVFVICIYACICFLSFVFVVVFIEIQSGAICPASHQHHLMALSGACWP